MANQPDIIPMAWAANNSTADSIPETTSESGKASWDQGFPVETSLPLSQGGVPPKYGDFNGILKILSQFALYAQAGGQYAWNNTLAYGVGSIVLGTDGNLYRAAQESTAVNPVGDASGKWERVVSQSDLAAISATATQAAAAANTAQQTAESAQSAVTTLDSNAVKLSGDQTVGGAKTFTSTIIASGGTFLVSGSTKPQTLYRHSTLVKGTGSATQQGMDFEDKNGVSIGAIWQQTNTANANYMRFIANDIRTASATASASVCLRYDSDGASIFHPWGSNVVDLGSSTDRWKNTYLVTNPNVSSDERVKTSINAIPDDVLDAWADVNWSQFQMNDAVEEKGINNARLHTGLIAQRIDEVFTAHGLDATRYGLFCHDVWSAQHEERDENGVVTQDARDAGDMYSLRYTEALCMEAAYQRRRADRMVARISEMERRLNEMESVLAALIAPVGDETFAGSEEGEAQA